MPNGEIGLVVLVIVAVLQGIKRLLGAKAAEPQIRAGMYFLVWAFSLMASFGVFLLKGDNPMLAVPAVFDLAYQIAAAAVVAYEGGKAVLSRLMKVV